jgi:hypothetical protein
LGDCIHPSGRIQAVAAVAAAATTRRGGSNPRADRMVIWRVSRWRWDEKGSVVAGSRCAVQGERPAVGDDDDDDDDEVSREMGETDLQDASGRVRVMVEAQG